MVRGSRLTLRFDDREVDANAGCNAFGGPYEIKKGTISVDGGMTQMGCGEGLEEQEPRLARLLSKGLKISFDSDRNLRLADGSTTVVLEQTAGR